MFTSFLEMYKAAMTNNVRPKFNEVGGQREEGSRSEGIETVETTKFHAVGVRTSGSH